LAVCDRWLTRPAFGQGGLRRASVFEFASGLVDGMLEFALLPGIT
jgi:hypothetical protein